MTRVSKRQHTPITSLEAAAAAAASNLIRVDQAGNEETKMTLTQLATLLIATQFGGLPAAGSALTFTVTQATSGAIGAISSGVNYGFTTKGQMEFMVETVKANKAAIDVLRAL